MRLLGAVAIVGAMIALSTTPVGAQDDFDEEAASAEVIENLIGLFDYLAIAGDPDSDPADVEAALAAAAALVEGGDTDEVKAQVPGIAGLAFAAQLTVIVDEEPTFDESGTTANYLFSTLSFGNPSQVDKANGIHVLEDGTWKLAAVLWEAFVALGGDSSPEDVDDGNAGEEDVSDTAEEELANTGVNSDVLAIFALALVGAGAMLVTSSRRRTSFTD